MGTPLVRLGNLDCRVNRAELDAMGMGPGGVLDARGCRII